MRDLCAHKASSFPKRHYAEHAALLAEKRAAYQAYREARAEMKMLLTYRANTEAILGVDA